MTKFNGIIDADTLRKSLESSIKLSFEPIMQIKKDGIYIQDADNNTSPALILSIFISKKAFDEYNYEKDMEIKYRGQTLYDNLKRLWGGIIFGTEGEKIQLVETDGGKKFEMRLLAIEKDKEKDIAEFFEKLETYKGEIKFGILNKQFKDALKDALSLYDAKDWKSCDITTNEKGLFLSTEKDDGINKFEFKMLQKKFPKAKARFPLNQISDAFASIHGEATGEFSDNAPIKVVGEKNGIVVKFIIAPIMH